MIIIPSVYPDSLEEVVDRLYILGNLSKRVQIVICDGSYGLRKSWNPTGKEILPSIFDYEFDCILTSWRECLMKAYKMGVKSVVIHIDEFTDDDYTELFKLVHAYNFTLGITVSNDVSVDVLIKAVHKIKTAHFFIDPEKVFIQVTGVRNLEDNKHPFDERVLHRIRALKKLSPAHKLQVSGRINPETVGAVKLAGADRIVVSTYIFGHQDIEEAIGNLIKAIAVTEITTVVEPVAITVEKEVVVPPPKIATKKEKGVEYTASTNEIVYESDNDPFA